MPINGIEASVGLLPGTPTIGTATPGNAQASVAFTVPSYTGKGGTVTYRAISSPGNFQATSTSSPIVVTGLSNGTAYTFQVRAETSYGVNSPYSTSSNSATPINPIVVTGGTLTSDATFYYRTFASGGTLAISNGTLIADYLVVSGGGGGGGGGFVSGRGTSTSRFGGGGGAGGAILFSSVSMPSGNYAVSIGSGGAGGPVPSSGSSGAMSAITGNTTNAQGGGSGGGGDSPSPGGNGGSGGGGGFWSNSLGDSAGNIGGSGISGQGNNGGNAGGGPGAGGGRGSAAGGNTPGSAATFLGVTVSAGGTGGSNGAAGASNTGNGGNGMTATNSPGGNGGSGVVVVRYTRSQVGG